MNSHKTILALLAAVALALLTVNLEEGFESGTVPPPGWTLTHTSPQTWEIWYFNPMPGGYHCATVLDDPACKDRSHDPWQNEILFSSEFRPAAGSGRVEFWSKSSLYWCRDVLDHCDLEVWLVRGGWADGGDDVRLGLADPDWAGTWVWSRTAFDFGEFADGGPARIAFRYTGCDGAQVSLDDISITYLDANTDGKIFLPIILLDWRSCESAKSEKEYDE